MCFFTSQPLVVKRAANDIFVWKIVSLRGPDVKDVFISAHRGFIYKLGKVYELEEKCISRRAGKILDTYSYTMHKRNKNVASPIRGGAFHSFSALKYVHALIGVDVLVSCIIPKGSLYAIGKNKFGKSTGEVVSSAIKINRVYCRAGW